MKTLFFLSVPDNDIGTLSRLRKRQADLSILSPSAYKSTVGLEIGKSKQYTDLNSHKK